MIEEIKNYSIDAEQQFLGSMLILSRDSSPYEEISIDPSSMYQPSHEKILRGAIELFNSGKAYGSVELHEYFLKKGELNLVEGGFVYFDMLEEECLNANRWQMYERSIKEDAKVRKMSLAGHNIKMAMNDTELNHDEKMAECQNLFDKALGDEEAVNESVTIGKAMKNYIEFLDWRFHNNYAHGVLTGIKKVDERLQGLKDGELIIIAGRPGSGKSTYATNIMLNAAGLGSKAYFFSLEMPERQLMQRMTACIGNIPLNSLKDASALNDYSPHIVVAANKIKKMSIEIDDNANVDVSVLINRCKKQKRKHGLDIIIIDYLQLLTDRTVKDNKRLEIGGITRKLKGLAKELSVPVILLSQVSRKCEDRKGNDGARPMMSDLAESADVEANADIIQMIYRDEYYHEDSPAKGIIEIITRKFRDGEPGTDCAHFVGNKNQIKDLEHEYTPVKNSSEYKGSKYNGK